MLKNRVSAICVDAVSSNRLRIALSGGVALVAIAAFSLAHAAGTGLPTQDTDAIAHSFGGSTVDDDPSIAYTNPAGMVLIKGNAFEGDLNLYDINSEFNGQDTISNTGLLTNSGINVLTTPTASAGGQTHVKNFLETTVIPSTFAVNSLPGGLKLGITVTTPNGGRIKYPYDFVGRFQGTEALLTQLQIGVMLAVPVTDKFSIGGGPIVDWFQNYVSLDQAEKLGLDSQTTGGNGAQGRFRADGYALGYDVGAMYQFSPDTRIGVNYHSKITHDFKGTETIALGNLSGQLSGLNSSPVGTVLNLLGQSVAPPPYGSPATDKFVFPQTISFGLYQRISHQLDVMVSAQWTDWQQAGDLLIADPTTANYTNGIIYTPFHYRNTWTVGIGADYYPDILPNLKLMGGVGYDETPVLTAYRNDLLPDNNRFMLSGGFSYQVLHNLKASFAYAHYFIAPTSIMQSRTSLYPPSPTLTSTLAGTPGTLTGEYHLSANVFSTGLVLSF
jgi:long-chain fatty acid transport protein